jgi:CheY-like chemotaxis protein
MAAPHVLLIAADGPLLQALGQLLPLRLPGAVIETSADAAASLDRIATTDYGVVALDLGMPALEAGAWLARVRSLRPETSILVLAGSADLDLALEALRAGARELVAKPIDWEVLAAVIGRALRSGPSSHRPKEPRPASAVRAENAAAGPARRILVIEDDADGREVLQIMLQSWGHEVEMAANGPDGLALALAGRFDIALIDIGLPGLDGYAVARQLRAAPTGRGLRLVALTGYGEPEDRRRALAAGFDVHLVKPVDPARLAETLRLPPAGGA